MIKQDTIKELKVKLKDAWVRAKEWRIEVGALLLELRAQAEHGEWGKLLAELGIPNSTAADHMVEASRHIYGIRKIGEASDPEAIEIEQAVNEAMSLVEEAGKSTTPIPISEPKPQSHCQTQTEVELDLHTKIKGPVLHCTADQKAAYKAAAKADHDRVYQIFHAALMEVIGENEEVADEVLAA